MARGVARGVVRSTGVVSGFHFAIGIILTIQDGMSSTLGERFGVFLYPQFRLKPSLRSSIAILGDMLILNALILTSTTLTFHDRHVCHAKEKYYVAFSDAFVGYVISTLLCLFPSDDPDTSDDSKHDDSTDI